MVKIFALVFGNAVFGQRGGSNLHSDGAMTDRERTILNDLVPREQKEALKRLFMKIDTDGNENLSRVELARWTEILEQRYIGKEIDRWWPFYNIDGDEKVSEKEFLERLDQLQDHLDDDHALMKERFKFCDFDESGGLDMGEFETFQFPRYDKKSKIFWHKEMFMTLDKNKNEKVDFAEFILYQGIEIEALSEEDKKSNQEHFDAYDENKDGTLDFKELIQLFDPEDGNSFEATADHLIYHADKDHDGVITLEEFLDNYETVLSSHISDNGQLFHDEL